ncbi:serine/threonine-protein kinase [Demequina iriomotensis]|uniref:serine/threonine-protein kinase n=1 Tax=Demequina iriomotensis TaxID=1536641 RepID=UPI0007804F7B|nr:serine/threonine-protein kinase [Demequina iriomotensis]
MAGLQREVGDVVGGYRVQGRLGSGGSGSVYRVVDEGGQEAALKLVDAREDEVAAARLAREVRALQSLRHPAVPHILDAELDDAETFVVFEIVPGETLFDHIRHHGPLAGEALAAFAERTASALEAVHAAGVVHRDVTPSNVMMGPDGPVLIDFGLAHRTEDARLTREGLVSGTPGYVAPEVIDGAEPGAQADRWSWAATVAFAMTAQAPFGSGTGAISRTLEAEVRLPDVPGAATLRAALGRDVAARPGMRDVVAALSGATDVLPALPPTAVAPVGLAEAAWGADAEATAVLPSGEHVPVHDAAAGWGDQDGLEPDEPAWEDLVPEDDEGYLEPAPRRRLLLLLAALVVIAAAALAPVVTALVLLGVAILARGVQRRELALEAADARRGRRRTTDTVVQTIGLPWHVLRAAVETIPAALTAAAAGGGVAAGAWWLVGSGSLGLSADAVEYAQAGALALGAAAAVVAMAYGPFMRETRAGAHRLAAAVSPTAGLAAAWALVAVSAVLVAGIAVYAHVGIWWWPLTVSMGASS